MSTDPDIEHEILRCIDEALGTLGSNGRKALLLDLEKNAGVKRKDILAKPEVFCSQLNLILGRQGGVLVRKLIVKKLLSGFGLQQKPNLTLAETIDIVRATRKKPRGVGGSIL